MKQVKALNGARKAAIAANSKFLSTAATFPQADTSALAVVKAPLLALLTNVGSAATTQASFKVAASATGYGKSVDLVDVLTCTKITTDSDGAVSVSSKAGAPMVSPSSIYTLGAECRLTCVFRSSCPRRRSTRPATCARRSQPAPARRIRRAPGLVPAPAPAARPLAVPACLLLYSRPSASRSWRSLYEHTIHLHT